MEHKQTNSIDYIRIDIEILKLNISDKAKMLLGLIKCLNKGLMMSNPELGELLNCSESNISRLLREIDKYVRIENPQSRYRKVFYSGKSAEVEKIYSCKNAKVDSESTLANEQPTLANEQPTLANLPDIIEKKHFVEKNISFGLSELLLSLILSRKEDFREGLPDRKQKTLERWTAEADRMIRLDRRKPEVIEEVIRWSQADNFWQNNILSMAKLRQKFDALELKMGNNDNGKQRGRTNRTDNKFEIPKEYATSAIET